MTPESKVRVALQRAVKAVGGQLRKLSYEGRAGAPDWLVLVPEWRACWMVELKAPGKLPTAHQRRELSLLDSCGVTVYVVDGPEAVDAMIDNERGFFESCGVVR